MGERFGPKIIKIVKEQRFHLVCLYVVNFPFIVKLKLVKFYKKGLTINH
jgi:hypothetical protein